MFPLCVCRAEYKAMEKFAGRELLRLEFQVESYASFLLSKLASYLDIRTLTQKLMVKIKILKAPLHYSVIASSSSNSFYSHNICNNSKRKKSN